MVGASNPTRENGGVQPHSTHRGGGGGRRERRRSSTRPRTTQQQQQLPAMKTTTTFCSCQRRSTSCSPRAFTPRRSSSEHTLNRGLPTPVARAATASAGARAGGGWLVGALGCCAGPALQSKHAPPPPACLPGTTGTCPASTSCSARLPTASSLARFTSAWRTRWCSTERRSWAAAASPRCGSGGGMYPRALNGEGTGAVCTCTNLLLRVKSAPRAPAATMCTAPGRSSTRMHRTGPLRSCCR